MTEGSKAKNPAALPRLAPLPVERWGDDARAALEAAFPGAAPHFLSGGPDAVPIPTVLGTLMHHPALTGPFTVYNKVLLDSPALGHRSREIMVLRVAWRTRSPYEWAQHVKIGEKLGMTAGEIGAITRDDPAGFDGWTPLEADLLAATDQMIDGYRIEDETWARLAEQLDERQLVEVAFTVGTYTCLAMALNSFGVQLDPGLDAGLMK